MHIATGILGFALVAIVLADAFQTVIVARHGAEDPCHYAHILSSQLEPLCGRGGKDPVKTTS